MKWMLRALLTAFLAADARACIWDAESLAYEKRRSKDLASAILGEAPPAANPQQLRDRIADLETHRNEASAAWWNDLAGAHLRLNEPAEAVKLLEPVAARFPDDYGIHANLGTAYHLLGRYADAEKEIARDLQINPDAHFDLERYHLALLQYLMRDVKYQSRHVYVDELTPAFLVSYKGRLDIREGEAIAESSRLQYTNGLAEAESDLARFASTNYESWDYAQFQLLAQAAALDPQPAYATNWDLAENTNLEAGVLYMAQMNPREPAAMEMLGVAAWNKRDYHLAVAAFQKAIALGSPKSELLLVKIRGLNEYIADSFKNSPRAALQIAYLCLIAIALLILAYIYQKIRDRWLKSKPRPDAS